MILLTSDGITSQKMKDIIEEEVISKGHKTSTIIVTANKRFKKKDHSLNPLIEDLEHMGLSVTLFDYDSDDIQLLDDSDLIVLGGGNPFYLLLKMKQHNQEVYMKDFIKRGKTLIGISGGSLVLQKTLGLIDVFATDMNMRHGGDLQGLGLCDVEMLPHRERYTQNFKDFEVRVKDYEDKHNIKSMIIDDKEGILFTDSIRIIK